MTLQLSSSPAQANAIDALSWFHNWPKSIISHNRNYPTRLAGPAHTNAPSKFSLYADERDPKMHLCTTSLSVTACAAKVRRASAAVNVGRQLERSNRAAPSLRCCWCWHSAGQSSGQRRRRHVQQVRATMHKAPTAARVTAAYTSRHDRAAAAGAASGAVAAAAGSGCCGGCKSAMRLLK
jgi:hypothetical protein